MRTVAVCGIDGAGKSTVIEYLISTGQLPGAARSTRHGRANVRALASSVDILGDVMAGPMAHEIRLAHALDFLAYYHLVHARDRPASKTYLLCDRWKLCYLAWSLTEQSSYPAVSRLLEAIPDTDVTIVLDLDPTIAAARAQAVGANPEQNSAAVLTAFRAAYLELAPSQPDTHVLPVDAEETPQEVARRLLAIVAGRPAS